MKDNNLKTVTGGRSQGRGFSTRMQIDIWLNEGKQPRVITQNINNYINSFNREFGYKPNFKEDRELPNAYILTK